MRCCRIAALFCCLPVTAFGATSFATLRAGIEATWGTFPDNGQSVKFSLVRADPKRVGIRVADTLHELGRGNNLSAFSLRTLGRAGALVAVNAGSTESYSVPIAAGLLVVRGRTVSPVNRQAAAPGFVCINESRVSVVKLADLDIDNCPFAVQRGPILLPGVRPGANQPHRRTIVAVDSAGRLLLLVTADRATLGSVYDFLTSSRDVAIVSAMNMDGDASSGMFVSPTLGGQTPSEVGNIDALVASAIVLYSPVQ